MKAIRKFRKRVLNYIDKNPNRSFYIILGILFILIVISNILGSIKPKPALPQKTAKQVEIYAVGTAPKVEVLATIEKSGVVTINALSPGIVQSIRKPVGSKINRGEVLINLSSNYQGANTASLQRSMAQKQYDHAIDSYEAQKELIQKQKDIAQKVDDQSDQLRDITSKSVDETNSLINLNNEIIASLNTNIANLESTNTGGSNDALILSTKQLKSQFLAGTNAARQGVRMAEFNAGGDNIALKQLDLQQKMLDLSLDISGIQLKIARVVESLMYPSAPFSGTVERVFVKKGESVNPGTPLAVLSGDSQKDTITAVSYITSDLAKRISKLEESILKIDEDTLIKEQPSYISSNPIKGTLHAVYFDIPNKYAGKVTEKGYIKIQLPVGYFDTTSSVPFIPIDAVYQTKDKNFIFVDDNGTAKSISVELGKVIGSFVEIKKGLSDSDKVILNRDIIDGDKVSENAQ